MSFPAIAQVDAYWEGLRAGRLMPARAEVDPRGMEAALEHAFILDYIGRGVGRLRIAGMHLNDLLGMEVRGMPLTSFFLPEARERVAMVLEDVVTRPQVADLSLVSPRGIGRPALAARMYLAPLASIQGDMPRIIGCLQSLGGIGRAPRRFEIEKIQSRRIIATAPTRTEAREPQRGFAEASGSFNRANARANGPSATPRPHLHLVSRDD